MSSAAPTRPRIEVGGGAGGGAHQPLALGHRPTMNASRMRWTRAVTTITTVRVFNKTSTRAELQRELSYKPRGDDWKRQTRKRSHRT